MKKILENLYIYIFLSIIFGVFVANVLVPDKTFSDYENRVLQEMPKISIESILDGSFQEKFDTYTSDQIVLKNYLVKAKNYMDLAQLKFAINEVYTAKDDFYIERHSIKDYDFNLLKKNIDVLNAFKDKYNAEIYLIPNASTILSDKIIYQNDIDFNKYLGNIEGIEFVDNILNNYNGNKSDLFYKTDHHWTTIAAYELYKNIVENPISLNLKKVDETFYGTIHNKLNVYMEPDTIYKHNSDTNFSVYYDLGKKNLGMYFDKYLETKDKYSYFLDSNHGLIQIINEDIVNNEKILIIKDSYANCFAPLIAENYKQVDVMDLRYFNMPLSNYLKIYNYDRIIVLYNKDGFVNNTDIYKLNK